MMRGRNALIAILSILVVGGVAAGVYFYFIAPRMNNETPQQEELQHEEPEQTIECTDHTYGDGSTVTPASCTVAGKKERTCTLCGEKQEETLPALGHDLVGHAVQAATCMEIGWNAYDTCSRCDYTTYTEISALGHDVIHHAAQEATCTAIGWNAYDTCSRCDYTTYEEIPALGHDVIHHAAQETTCTEIGWEAYDTCSRCDYTTYEEISALGHDIVHHTAQDPTCTDIGWEAYDTCSRCDYTTYAEISALGHDVVHHAAQAVTCTTIGWNAYDTCSRCDYTTYEVISAMGHIYVNGVCSVCGEEEPVLYTRVDINGEEDVTGDYLLFGSYPQTEVTDEDVKTALTTLAGTLPTSGNSQNWTSYGYYISSSNSTDYMWYIDLEYGGEKYRGVYFTSYRPYDTAGSSSTDYSIQDDYSYYISTVYWFRYEPIKWRILSNDNVEALILCEMIIDSQDYYPSKSSSAFSHNGGTGYANNYALSNIRKWLNDTFYNTAFTALEKDIIKLTTVDNSKRSTNPNDYQWQWDHGGNNQYACADTEDYIFLLSEQEVTTSAYGFSSYSSTYDTVRRKKTTPYAQCQGTYTYTESSYYGNGWWWLRSPYYSDNGGSALVISTEGNDGLRYNVTRSYIGVVPALTIQLRVCEEHTFGEWSTVTAATCTETGIRRRYCTVCGWKQEEVVSALGHDLIHHEGQAVTCTEIGWQAYDTCSRCDYSTYELIPATGHIYDDGVCSVCGAEETAYTRININGEEDAEGRYLYFGTYPQSEVTDEDVKTALTAQAGELPTEADSKAWTSYGYYIDGSKGTDYMWYIDVEYNYEKYRGVYFTSYRPDFTTYSTGNRYQFNNGYITSTVYWFKYEPIKWRILSEESGEALILCEMIIDSQEYCHYTTTSQFSHNGGTGYANNYALSNIRKWLNETFYNTAFSDLQKAIIQVTTVNNSARSTNPNGNATQWNSGMNSYACADTQDKVFLLSEQEVTNTVYGFNSNNSNQDTVRLKQNTDYAKCQGARTSTESSDYGNGMWWLRSPYFNDGKRAWWVFNGRVNTANDVNYTSSGVVPALKIQLQQ